MPESKPGLSTRAVHSGNDVDQKMVTRPKTLPIYESSVFVYDSLEQVDDFLAGNPDNYMYTRIANPNQAALEQLVRELEGGAAALFSASGMAAVSANTPWLRAWTQSSERSAPDIAARITAGRSVP